MNGQRMKERLRRLIYPFQLHSRIGVPTMRTVPVRRAPRVRRDRSLPGWLLPLLVGVLGLGLAAVLLTGDPPPQQSPAQLDRAQLSGERQVTGRACVVLASDVSGSMTEHAADRRAALQELTRFSRRVLRPDDVVAVVTYDGAMSVALPPTTVRDLPDGYLPEPRPGGPGTALLPVIQGISSLLESHDCAATGLASVTDGKLQDDATSLDHALRTAALQRVHLLVPGGEGRPGPTASELLDEVEVHHFDPGDATQLGLGYGRLIAELTGQELRGS